MLDEQRNQHRVVGGETLGSLTTEARSNYEQLDQLHTDEILAVMNAEDQRVPIAVAGELPRIAAAVDLIVTALQAGGRLFYVGAGTSGRLGALDAAECPPTFGVSNEMVQAVLAGGAVALNDEVAGAEDDEHQGERDLEDRGVSSADVVAGIAASGRTPYVIGALRAARRSGARTVALVCNAGSPMGDLADVTICPIVGPEVLLGSTRLKAGTAQKLVLNMLSTASMIRLGKVYSNLMVDLQPANAKLYERARRIVQLATGCSDAVAAQALAQTGNRPKVAIVMLMTGCTAAQAEAKLREASGFVRQAIHGGRTGT